MKLKNLFSIAAVCAFCCAVTMSFTSAPETTSVSITDEITTTLADDGYVYVYFQNNCGKEIKWEIKYSGHGSSGSIREGSKERKTIQTGGKIYIDGDYLMTIEEGNDGKTYNCCK